MIVVMCVFLILSLSMLLAARLVPCRHSVVAAHLPIACRTEKYMVTEVQLQQADLQYEE
jgi:hypothetical protein